MKKLINTIKEKEIELKSLKLDLYSKILKYEGKDYFIQYNDRIYFPVEMVYDWDNIDFIVNDTLRISHLDIEAIDMMFPMNMN